MHWYAGTSGYSYKPWKGPFYPEDLPDDQMLRYYGEHLPAVEINNTFYRMPRTSVLEKWAEAVPDHFRFVIKASRRITHQHRLKDAEEPTRYLLDKVTALGPKLGAVLFQLPPYLRCDAERLEGFLALLPAGVPAAFEFRHDSWDVPEIRAMLADAGATVCVADAEDGGAQAPVLPASPWLYLRLRRPDYTGADLRRWQDRAEASGAETGFVFFKHEDEGAAPAMARRFLELAGKRRARAPQGAPAKRTGTRRRA